MKSLRFSEKSIPVLFLLLTILGYGLLLPFTGFYWDDWPFAWIAKFLGPAEFVPAFEGVRPFLGPIFLVTTSLIPPVPPWWQIVALLIRFVSGLAAWFALSRIWPHHKRQALVASVLFLLFPGYSQHWVAFTHINQEWIPLILYLFSFGFTARALRDSGSYRTNTMVAIVLMVAGVFPTEYFIGLEPLRFLFIWVIVSEDVAGFRSRLLATLRHWWFYLVIWLGNALWLAYFYTLGTYGSYEVEVVREPLSLMPMLSAIGEAVWKAGMYVWGQVILLTADSIAAPSSLVSLLLTAAGFVLLIFYLTRLDLPSTPYTAFAIPAILIGIAGMVLGRVPSLAAGLPLTLQSSFDRLMISMMLGGSLFVTGVVDLLFRDARLRNIAFSLLIALAIGQQFFNANIFRRDWTKQQEFYWQLAWRIPAMQPDTALLTDQLPIDYETDLSFSAPINWIYAPDYQGGDLPYALIYVEKRLGRGALPSLERDVEITLDFRTVAFHGSTSQAITIFMPPNGCLRVLDPARGDALTYGRQSRYLVDAIALSDPSRILLDAGETPRLPFLREPEHTWCYYYARAELGLQQGEWDQINTLISEAISRGYGPEDPFEWLPYIEALGMTGSLAEAERISANVLVEDKGIRRGLCLVWARLKAREAAPVEAIERILSEIQCPS